MDAKTLANYGGAYSDAAVVENPETDVAADYLNRALEDVAQATRTVWRATLNFTTTSDAAPATVATATIDHNTVWGSGASTRPTISKTAGGRYTVTFATTYTDDLAEVETVAFVRGIADAMSSDPLDDCKAQILTIAGNIITLKTEAPTGTLADVGDNSAANFEVTLFLR